MTDLAADTAAAPVTTLPAGGVLESNTPPPSAPPSDKASFGAAIAAVPSRADDFLAHLLRCLQTRAGADVVLQFLCYAARLSGSVLESFSRSALRHSAQKLIDMAFHLPPTTSVTLGAPPISRGAALAMRLAGQFKALSALLSETRTVNRLWGLLGLYFGLKRLLVKTRGKTTTEEKQQQDQDSGEARFDTLVAYTQVTLLIFYQIFENLSFLGGKKVLDINPALRARMANLSVRCWGGWIGVELARLLVVRARASPKTMDAGAAGQWRKSFLRNLAWAPITVHWSMANGPLSDMAVSLLAIYPSTSQMIDLWRQNA